MLIAYFVLQYKEYLALSDASLVLTLTEALLIGGWMKVTQLRRRKVLTMLMPEMM